MKILTFKIAKKEITPILRRRGVAKAAFFGSFARGEAKKTSDIDLLVGFKGDKSLLDMVGLRFELEKKLGKKVDLLTYGAIHPRLKKYILKDQKLIYGKRS